MVLNAPVDAHAPKNKGGRPRGAMTRVKRDLRDCYAARPARRAGDALIDECGEPESAATRRGPVLAADAISCLKRLERDDFTRKRILS
jgi:hypothetical protein